MNNMKRTDQFVHGNNSVYNSMKVRPVTIKLLEENIGKTLSDIFHSNIFFNQFPRIMEIKAKTNKRDLLDLKQ